MSRCSPVTDSGSFLYPPADKQKGYMNETTVGRIGRDTVSEYHNSSRARTMYAEFNGEQLADQKLFAGIDPQAILKNLAAAEWGKAAESILPPEILEAIKPLATTLVEKFGSFIDAASERLHAEELRNSFGEPQSPLAFPVFNALTSMLEEGFQAEIQAAHEAKSLLDWLRQQVRETILVWHLAQVAKKEANLKELDEVEQNIEVQGATTQIAAAEAKTMIQALKEHKTNLQAGLQEAQQKLLTFASSFFGNDLNQAETMVYQAPRAVVIPQLDASKAIPVAAGI